MFENNLVSLKLREGIRIFSTGGTSDMGRLVLTKVLIDGIAIKDEIMEILKNIRFPATISIDANGFLEIPKENKVDVIFCFSSVATGMKLPNGKSWYLVINSEDMTELINFVKDLKDEDFMDTWFRTPDSVVGGPGIRPRRIVNLVITVDPFYLPVTKLI